MRFLSRIKGNILILFGPTLLAPLPWSGLDWWGVLQTAHTQAHRAACPKNHATDGTQRQVAEVVVLLLDLGDLVDVLHVHRAHHLVHCLTRALLHARAALSEGPGGGCVDVRAGNRDCWRGKEMIVMLVHVRTLRNQEVGGLLILKVKVRFE